MAVVTPTGNGAVRVNHAAGTSTLQMSAVTVLAPTIYVGTRQVPFDNALLNVLTGQGEPQPTATCLAEIDAVLTINLRPTLKLILVYLRLLKHHTHPVVLEFLHQSLANLPLAFIEFFLSQQPFIDEQFYKGI